MNKATHKQVQDRVGVRLLQASREADNRLKEFEQSGRDVTLMLNQGVNAEVMRTRQELLDNAAPLNAPLGYSPVQMLVDWPLVSSPGQVKATVSGKVKKYVIESDKVCRWCMVREAKTVDHVIPRSRGGSNDRQNLVGCCLACNQAKGDFVPRELGWVLHLPLRAFG